MHSEVGFIIECFLFGTFQFEEYSEYANFEGDDASVFTIESPIITMLEFAIKISKRRFKK